MSKKLLAILLALSALLCAGTTMAQTRDDVRAIEREYARQTGGRMIPDNQLEYYLDRMGSGWSMRQISADISASRRSAWRPQTGYIAREVVCSSEDNRYRECRVPFRGTAVITRQISDSACIEGRSWGQKPGIVWVNRGCRARFGIVQTAGRPGNGRPGNDRGMIVCQSDNQGQLRTCRTGIRGDVELVRQLRNSATCVEGRTWGQRSGEVWVRGGCRAQFRSDGRPGPRDDDDRRGDRRGDRWDANYAMNCDSINDRTVRCDWDERRGGMPRIQRQTSDSPCVAGRTWGYDEARNDIWVSRGCRARFVGTRF